MTLAQLGDILLTTEVKIIVFVVCSLAIFSVHWLIQLLITIGTKKGKKISLDIVNIIRVVVRIGGLLAELLLFYVLFLPPAEIIVWLSVFLGAIVSFGSTKSISNFIAGLYIMIVHPFGVDDIIELEDEIRGQVIEISLNYTKIRTVNNIFHLIPNENFLKANIILFKQKVKRNIGTAEAQSSLKKSRFRLLQEYALSFIEEDVVWYTFTWGVPLGNLELSKRKLQEVCEIYAGVFGFTPEFFLYTMGYRMQFKFVVITHNSEILIENIRDFRNDIVAKFH
ncbi:MAG: mechanosensitive ion channel domain-containing protein [Candidatus Kariarchaeaceae archaeon]|jgi:small-conductance mechanosensitive channel